MIALGLLLLALAVLIGGVNIAVAFNSEGFGVGTILVHVFSGLVSLVGTVVLIIGLIDYIKA